MATVKDRYILEMDTRGATTSLGNLSTAVKGFVAVLAVDKLKEFGRQIVDTSAKFQNYENQLRLITSSQDELNDTMGKLTQAAKDNRSSFADTVDLYTKLTLATEELGKSQDEILSVTGKFQQALAISGADAGTAAGAIRQFGQAMASGTVRGDEFNSIVEALGPALAIMARESGLTVGELRRMSQAGELTADAFFEMVNSSQALSAAFNSTRQTIPQLEQGLSDAFDRVIVKIGEASGVTAAYEDILKNLTRTADAIAGVEGALVNLTVEEILAGVESGSISAAAAVEELSAKLIDISKARGAFPIPRLDNIEERRALEETIQLLQQRLEAEKELAAEAQKIADAENARKAALDAVLAPHQKFIEQAQKFADTDYRTELEKANQRVIDAEIVLEQLNLAFERSNGQVDNFIELLRGSQNELEAAKARVQELKEKSNELAEEDAFTKFYNSILDRANDANEEIINTQLAITKLGEDLEAGRISLDTYAFAMELLTEKFKNSGDEADELAEKLKQLDENTKNAIDTIDARIAQSAEAATLSGLQGIERTLKQIELEELRLAEAAKERIRAQAEGIDPEKIQQALADIDRRTQEAIEARQADARLIESNLERFRRAKEEETRITREAAKVKAEAEEQARKAAERAAETFEKGWSRAYERYADEATNAAKAAERIFNKTTRGMEDAIVNFAKTGKFEFKDLVATILEELLRSQIQRLIAQTFGAFGAGGGASGANSLFGGFFANGGTLPAGKFGVVGEAGPELITGPANITPLNNFGGGAVTYNINAVDASSFKQMIARDPGFIHAVAQQGARKIPTRR
jgi:lambda family phage tail tape measure protein